MKIILYILGVVSLVTFVYCVIFCAISFNIIKLLLCVANLINSINFFGMIKILKELGE